MATKTGHESSHAAASKAYSDQAAHHRAAASSYRQAGEHGLAAQHDKAAMEANTKAYNHAQKGFKHPTTTMVATSPKADTHSARAAAASSHAHMTRRLEDYDHASQMHKQAKDAHLHEARMHDVGSPKYSRHIAQAQTHEKAALAMSRKGDPLRGGPDMIAHDRYRHDSGNAREKSAGVWKKQGATYKDHVDAAHDLHAVGAHKEAQKHELAAQSAHGAPKATKADTAASVAGHHAAHNAGSRASQTASFAATQHNERGAKMHNSPTGVRHTQSSEDHERASAGHLHKAKLLG